MRFVYDKIHTTFYFLPSIEYKKIGNGVQLCWFNRYFGIWFK